MSHPAFGYAAAPPVAPVSTARLFLAGAIDQAVILAVFLAFLGTGILAAKSGYDTQVSVTAGVIGGVLMILVCLAIQFALALTKGTTVGLFIIGARFNPSKDPDFFDDVGEWLLSFWRNLLLAPFAWLLFKLLPPRHRPPAPPGFPHDPRAHSGGARIARCLLVAAICASPVPLVLALLT